MRTCEFVLTMKNSSILMYVIAFFVLLTVGCSEKGGGESEVVAKVGNRSITVSDLNYDLSVRPMPYSSRVSKEDLEKRLDAMVLQEVLYQEALRLKLDQDPEMRGRVRQMLSQELLDEQVNRKVWEREIEESELQEYYDKHWNEFNRPEHVRLADIFIAVPADASDKQRTELRKKAETVLGEALEARGKRTGFGSLVRKYSDTHEMYGRGDTGFFDREGAPRGINKKLAEEAFKLERVGNMAEYVIETPDGYHIIILIGRRSAMHRPLDQVGNQLKQRMRREAVTKARQAYIESLQEQAEIEIDSQVMAGILEELNRKASTRQALSKNDKTPAQRGSVGPPAPLRRQDN